MPIFDHPRLRKIWWLAVFLFLLPLKDTRRISAQEKYEHAWMLFQNGGLAASQTEAMQGFREFRSESPDWASKFYLLEADAMVWGGKYDDALRLLDSKPASTSPPEAIRQLSIQAIALSHQGQNDAADEKLAEAAALCKAAAYGVCGESIRARGIVAVRRGSPRAGMVYLLESSSFAKAHHDRWLETNAAVNLGWAAIQLGHFDESADWSKAAYRDAVGLGAEGLAQLSSGNLGWAYLQLGDDERALEEFLQAETSAASLGNVHGELNWTSTAGYVYKDTGDLPRATESYHRAFLLAASLKSKEDIINALEDLAQVSVESGKLDEASGYLKQVTPMELAAAKKLSANVLLTEGMLAAAQHQEQQARALFQDVQNDADSPTTTRLNAGYQLALLLERNGDDKAAEKMFKATLAIFDSAQAQLKSEESNLPFAANAARIYDDYIQLLVQQGRREDALAVADQSRARTLAQALSGATSKSPARNVLVNPRQVAQKTGATLLFYWLGHKQSYLWAVTPAKITLFPLPAQKEIGDRVDRYSKFLLNLHSPLAASNQDAQDLYKLLILPAAKSLRPNAPAMILADGALTRLNFETLLVPGPSASAKVEPGPNSDPSPSLHYLLEDATLLSAPSLAMLAAAKPAHAEERSLLLFGNPASASDEFPSLPLFGFEMTRIEKHFAAQRVSAFDGLKATPAAYLSSNPARFSYIHFVSHAVASRTDPLDSAIILSGSGAGDDSYKLYARDIMQHPIDARLVTISACYGSGTRSYAGEGLVGLSWAFLRAGAQSVIGALWEVSDDSTPQMMDTLYKDLASGQPPAVALRNAKLELLHAGGRFSIPFYWAPFQIYTTH